jgi:3-ketosteroid 9alpha-monooxygenase subunit A
MPAIDRFPMGIPFGWYFVSYSDELAIGDVKPLHYFGRDLVLFRNESGVAGVLDAYCPHMGAHLGYGGRVDGEAIRCPFHAWAFKPDGFCVDIPYAKAFPPICKREPIAGPYPVSEANGVIWAWYHPEGVQPLYEVMTVPEFTEPGWAPQTRRMWRFRSNPQEIAENGVDVAHFEYVHRMDAVPEGKTSYEGHVRRSAAFGERTMTLPSGETRLIKSSVETVQNGAGQKTTHLMGLTTLALQVLVTPIEADECELRFCFTHPVVEPGSFEEKAIQAAIESTTGQTGVEGDIPIWDKKIHRARPLLCDGDGPILRFRRYFEQFYAPEDGGAQVIAAE